VLYSSQPQALDIRLPDKFLQDLLGLDVFEHVVDLVVQLALVGCTDLNAVAVEPLVDGIPGFISAVHGVKVEFSEFHLRALQAV